MKSMGLVSGSRLCHERMMGVTTNSCFFSKKNGQRNPGPDTNVNCAVGPSPRCQAWSGRDPLATRGSATRRLTAQILERRMLRKLVFNEEE